MLQSIATRARQPARDRRDADRRPAPATSTTTGSSTSTGRLGSRPAPARPRRRDGGLARGRRRSSSTANARAADRAGARSCCSTSCASASGSPGRSAPATSRSAATCTVLVDGEPVSSLHLLACDADGREVLTIEGLAESTEFARARATRSRARAALQCGFCTPGFCSPSTRCWRRRRAPRPRRRDRRARRQPLPLHRLQGRSSRPPSAAGAMSTAARPPLLQPLAPTGSGARRGARTRPREAPRPGPVRRRHQRRRGCSTARSCAAPSRTRGSSRSTPRGAEAMPGRRVAVLTRRRARRHRPLLGPRDQGPADPRHRPGALRRRAGGRGRGRGRGDRRGGAARDRRRVRGAAGRRHASTRRSPPDAPLLHEGELRPGLFHGLGKLAEREGNVCYRYRLDARRGRGSPSRTPSSRSRASTSSPPSTSTRWRPTP